MAGCGGWRVCVRIDRGLLMDTSIWTTVVAPALGHVPGSAAGARVWGVVPTLPSKPAPTGLFQTRTRVALHLSERQS